MKRSKYQADWRALDHLVSNPSGKTLRLYRLYRALINFLIKHANSNAFI